MSGGVPAGWVLVPVEPTQHMVEAAMATPGMSAIEATVHLQAARGYPLSANAFPNGVPPLRQAWSAMLAATPTPPIEGRDADVERVADEMFAIVGRVRRAECTYEEGHAAIRAAFQALGERG